jgi:hypothetical protein
MRDNHRKESVEYFKVLLICAQEPCAVMVVTINLVTGLTHVSSVFTYWGLDQRILLKQIKNTDYWTTHDVLWSYLLPLLIQENLIFLQIPEIGAFSTAGTGGEFDDNPGVRIQH